MHLKMKKHYTDWRNEFSPTHEPATFQNLQSYHYNHRLETSTIYTYT